MSVVHWFFLTLLVFLLIDGLVRARRTVRSRAGDAEFLRKRRKASFRAVSAGVLLLLLAVVVDRFRIPSPLPGATILGVGAVVLADGAWWVWLVQRTRSAGVAGG